MKRFILALLIAIALLLAYWAWPLVALHNLVVSLQTHDTAAVSEEVDFVRLRRSLTYQIATSYLRLTGRAGKLGILQSAVASAVGSIADPLVAQIVNPENLAILLNGGNVPTDFGKVSLGMGTLPAGSWRTVWQAWLAAEYGWGNFSIELPVTAEPPDRFRLRMQLRNWHWRLTGIDLPEKLANQFAQELAKKYP